MRRGRRGKVGVGVGVRHFHQFGQERQNTWDLFRVMVKAVSMSSFKCFALVNETPCLQLLLCWLSQSLLHRVVLQTGIPMILKRLEPF